MKTKGVKMERQPNAEPKKSIYWWYTTTAAAAATTTMSVIG
jgi:hypothetical protein